ncbi:MAG: hypothetical protein CMK65_02210 [Pseudoalteromonas sp.]|uniref:dynamin family protein n=1 Tax=Pseudoalteromonas sp. TaxID=53249 RepID=UPI000C923961|nr:dynamin family protein [Pseudoalteromonas sp.]MAD02428.1 hypothetical protein [Pseudoalteromonas sp.]|tara:strand:- start:12059 stop:13792 length:1734 start_codon:yes stop_codon:yes gene_type:complete
MLKKQKQFIEYLSGVDAEIKKTALTEHAINTFKIEGYIDLIRKQELLVPVIGAFSAGKSSLLNSFLGQKVLPEGITPETALATELRYSSEERIEAINTDDRAETFLIEDVNKLRERASEFKFIKMYLNNHRLLEIEPLVLVDMPGFESPLEQHNKAIMEYINKGVHYVVLTSVEDGTITKSMTRQLENIKAYKRDFSFFLSKTNLKPHEEIEEIKLRAKDQLEDYFGKFDEIELVNDDGGESLKGILTKINPEKLFDNLFSEGLKEHFFSIKGELNTQISALGKSKNQNDDAVEKLKKALDEITRKRDLLVEEAKSKYSDSNINRVVELVGRDLSESLEEIVNAGVSGGEPAISKVINEIVKSSLIRNIQDSMNEICGDIVDDFAVGLSDLNTTMSEFTLSDNWLEGITNTTKKMFDSVSGSLESFLNKRKEDKNNDVIYRTITSVLAITTAVINPILELVIVFLPDILNAIFGSMHKEKQKNQIRQAIITNIIPSLKRELRVKLPSIFNEQINRIVNDVASQFESVIQQKKESIEVAQRKVDEKNIDIEKTIATYKSVNEAVTEMANNTIYGYEKE